VLVIDAVVSFSYSFQSAETNTDEKEPSRSQATAAGGRRLRT